MAKVLIVDDEADMRWLLTGVLREQGFEIITAEDGQAALERVRMDEPSVILLDLKMPRLSGMEALEKIKAIDPLVPVIILTAYGEISSAVQAMRLGAYDYLTKPFRNDDILFTIRRALERQELLAQVEDLQSQVGEGGSRRDLIGRSPEIQKVFRQIHLVARTDYTVILQGETGTGKEIVARAIHQQSPRSGKPFVALDCGAIPETLIESELFGYEKGAFTGANRRKEGHFQFASGGTLLLDEIGNLPLSTQSKLLRVLQERRVQPLGAQKAVDVDVRIIVASNAALDEETKAGRFRQDLYYRINEFTILLPPLRERKEDILHLAKCFLEEAGIDLKKPIRGLSGEAAQLLLDSPWPGNVRELKNVIRQAALLCVDLVGPEHLVALGGGPAGAPVAWAGASVAGPAAGGSFGEGQSLREVRERATEEVEREAICATLRQTRGNKSQAAKRLQIDYKTLYSKIKQYGIRAREFLP
ncbi:MAG: sigma-54-dependent transcriptional regulator [Candidatus Methylomirabilales bacterium]